MVVKVYKLFKRLVSVSTNTIFLHNSYVFKRNVSIYNNHKSVYKDVRVVDFFILYNNSFSFGKLIKMYSSLILCFLIDRVSFEKQNLSIRALRKSH